MKVLVIAVAVVCGIFAVQEKSKKQDARGVQVLQPAQADWKQAEKMPQGVLMYKVAECKCGGCVAMVKIPAGTKVPAHLAEVDKVLHVHEGKIEIGEAEGKGQSVSSGGVVKISAGTSHWLTASSDTLILVAKDGCKKESP